MQEQLVQKLQAYLSDNHPDLLTQLTEEKKLFSYLQEKVAAVLEDITELQEQGAPVYIIEEISLDIIISGLPPSRYNYICAILLESFESTLQQWKESGTLQYEAINLINACEPQFEASAFSTSTQSSPVLRNAIKETIHQYINEN